MTYFFTFNSLAFFAKTLKSIVHLMSDEDISIYWFALITIIILAPLSWIRTIERFKIGFIYAGIVILLMIIVCVAYVSLRIEANDN